ncbi:MAG: InlB B-repeat-containing protein [Lentimicrobiaceae bacterium]|nr:InlB B-repeat-containing protein [Lentimicrobiaceae bacterium]
MKKIQLLFIALFISFFFFSGCKKEEFIVTFNPNGGKGELITQHFTQKVAQPLMANSYKNWGYLFKEWNTKPDGTGTSYNDQEKIIVSEHLVLYAQWIPTSGEFTVNFNANGGVGEMESQTFEAGVAKPLSSNRFYYDNYRFTGWNTSANGKGKSFENEQNVSITSDMTLYAQWTPISNTYFVFFDANGGEGKMESQKFHEYESQKLDSNTFTRTDYSFTGWNTKTDGSGYRFSDMQSISITRNIVLYAQWMKEPESCPGIPTVKDHDNNTYNNKLPL